MLKTVVTFTVTRYMYRVRVRLEEVLDFPAMKILGRYVLTLTAIALVDVLTVQIDKYLIVWFYRAREAVYAVYSIGAIEIPLVMLLVAAVSGVAMPEFSRLVARNDMAETTRLLGSVARNLGFLLIPGFFFLLCSGFVLVEVLRHTAIQSMNRLRISSRNASGLRLFISHACLTLTERFLRRFQIRRAQPGEDIYRTAGVGQPL